MNRRRANFTLLGFKVLLKIDMSHEVVLIDATEIPIEQQKKPKIFLFRKKEKAHIKKPGSIRQNEAEDHLHCIC